MRGGNYMQIGSIDDQETPSTSPENNNMYSGIIYPNSKPEISTVSMPSTHNVYLDQDWVQNNTYKQETYQIDDTHTLDFHINGIINTINQDSILIYVPMIILIIIFLFQK